MKQVLKMWSFYKIILIGVAASIELCFAADFLKEKPDYLQDCQIADPEFTKCSTKTVQQLFDKLATGIDGLDTLPAIDPMKIKKIRIFQGVGPVSINASLENVVVTGFSNVNVMENKVNRKDFSWETRFLLPKMRIEGDYDLKGRILILPLTGHGRLWIEAMDMSVFMYTKTRLYEKGGHTFYNVTNTKVDYNITGLRLRLNNLFEGIKALEESTNQYLNDNWKPASDALKPIVARTIEDILLEILQKIFHFLPADFIVTDIPKSTELYV